MTQLTQFHTYLQPTAVRESTAGRTLAVAVVAAAPLTAATATTATKKTKAKAKAAR